MGSDVCVECTNCDAGESYLLGVGMNYFDTYELLPRLPYYPNGRVRQSYSPRYVAYIQYGARKKVMDILDYHHVHSQDVAHRLYACPKCNTLHGRFYVRLEYDDCAVYEFNFRCGKCRTPLVEASEDAIESYACKKCGKQSLVRGAGMPLWD